MSGVGKSRLTMQLAKAMATGTDFLKWPIGRKIKVMYLSLEMQGDMLKHFLTGLLDSNTLPTEDSNNFLLVPVGRPVNLASPDGFDFIEMMIKEHEPEVVMI